MDDIIEIYRGVNVRKYNRINIRVNAYEFKRFIDAKIDNNISARKAIQKLGLLCGNSEPLIIRKYEKIC